MHASALLATSRSSEGANYYLYTPLRFPSPQCAPGLQAEGMSPRTFHSARRLRFVPPPPPKVQSPRYTHAQPANSIQRSKSSSLLKHNRPNIIYIPIRRSTLFRVCFSLFSPSFSCSVFLVRVRSVSRGRKQEEKIKSETNTELPPHPCMRHCSQGGEVTLCSKAYTRILIRYC